ncbi:MAG: NUDIX hydrolase [Firmicutes bacterium]|nr:NUDIX hydrolase [Bacillota bacterium]
MKLISEVCVDPLVKCEMFDLRRSVRAVLFNDKGEVALVNNKNCGWYALPGGTIDEGDSLESALRRECREEVGAEIKILAELGLIIEQRNEQGRIRINYYFVAKVVGELGEPKLEADEIEDGMTLEFHNLEKAIQLIREARPFGNNELLGKYQQATELAAITYYRGAQEWFI